MKDEFNTTGRKDRHDDALVPGMRTLTVDVEKYQSFLDGSDMTELQKEEFLQALWSIIINFVDLGFGVHPLQEACGQKRQTVTGSAKDDFTAVNSEKPNTEKPPTDSDFDGSLEIK